MVEKIETIAARVRELRELSKVSAEEMAKYLKIPTETYCGYEGGSLDIPASILLEIAQRLDVDMGLLLTDEESRMHIFTVTRKGEGVEVERRKQFINEEMEKEFPLKKFRNKFS